jgi:hypothetical protein
MCFSAPASFTSGSMLIAIDTYCLYHSRTKDKKYLLFALIPLFFGIQQYLEGFIWLGVSGGQQALINIVAYVYLFFAFAFWPFFVPVAVFLMQNKERPPVKAIVFTMILIGLGVAIGSYLPLLLGKITFQVRAIHHSLAYVTSRPVFLDNLFISLYVIAVILPFLVVSDPRMKIFGAMLLLSTLLTNFFYYYAFASVWCLFAAILSLYIAYIMSTLPHKDHKARSKNKRKIRGIA